MEKELERIVMSAQKKCEVFEHPDRESTRAVRPAFFRKVFEHPKNAESVSSRQVFEHPKATTVRFHGAAFAEIERRARKQNRTVTSFIRNLVLEALQQ